MKPLVSARESLQDDNLLGHTLKGDSRVAWRAIFIAMNGEPLTEEEREVSKRLTGRENELHQRIMELIVVAGRRGGKSQAIGSGFVPYVSALCDHSDVLSPGERGVVLVIAPDQRQASIVLEYAIAAFEQSPMLSQMIKNKSKDALELTNNISIEVRSASFRRLRGPTYVAVICDEAAYWFSEERYANPDSEIIAAVKPGLLTTGGPLIVVSSPYARQGILWDYYNRHYGPTGDALTLVAKGTSRDFNPTLSQAFIDRELEKDRVRATAEYLAEFRSDIEGYVPLEVVQTCAGDFRERQYDSDNSYEAFTDPSGGSKDSWTLAISHKDYRRDCVVIDAVREVRPPFSPEQVVGDFAALLNSYRISSVIGDAYGGEFPRELFRKHGISYELSELTRSELFRDLLPLLNSVRITLPNNDRLVSQIVGLERRVSAAGKETITHGPNGHDDLANAVAGAASLSLDPGWDISMSWVSGPERPPEDPREREERVRKLYELLLRGEPVPF